MLSGAQLIAFVLLDVAIILVFARLCGATARKIGQPAVVGEIIAGVILGPSLFGLIDVSAAEGLFRCTEELRGAGVDQTLSNCLFPAQVRPVLNALGQLALLLFMFLVGLELDFKQLSGKGRQIGLVALGVVAIPVVVAFAINPVMFTDTFVGEGDPSSLAFALFIAAIISITALPVMVRVLQEKGLATSNLGAVGIAAAAVVTVLMFLLVAIASGTARGTPTSELALKTVLAFVYLGVMVFVVRPALVKPLGEPYAERAQKLAIKAAKETWSGVDEFAPAGAGQAMSHAMFAWIFVLVLVSGWVAHILGINVIVGGFMAGLVIPERKGLVRDMTVELFDVVVVILLPVFLAFAGLGTDFTQLSGAAIPGIAVFIVACIVAKWGGGAVMGKAAGLSWGESNLLGILVNCRGLLPLVVALIGLTEGVISPAMQVGAVLMALITTAMTGPAFDRFNKPAPEKVPA